MIRKTLYILILLSSALTNTRAQDLSRIGSSRPVKVSGGFNINSIYNSANISNPFSYYLGGNLNFDFYGWNIPLSFSYSNREHTFTQPFNQYGLSPAYKWITLHLGYRALNFSKYSYAGLLFNGGGAELMPDNGLRFTAFYGRIQKAYVPDSSANDEISFRRMAYGAKFEYSFHGHSLNLSLFKAYDILNSINLIPENSKITPQENLALTFGGTANLLKGLTFNLELASSALTEDIRSDETSETKSLFNHTGKLYVPRESSGYFWAGKAGFNYTFWKSILGINYEIIDPGYKTLGQYYTNNDIETIALNFGQSFLKDKLNLNLNAGRERNNLGKNKVEATSRFVFAVNLAVRFSESLQFNGSYSTFRSYTRVRTIFEDLDQIPGEPVDSLNFAQINKSLNAGISWTISKSQQTHQGLNLNIAYQGGVNKTKDEDHNSLGFTESITYRINWIEKLTTLIVSVNSTQNTQAGSRYFMLGPSASINKSFFNKKLKSGFRLSYHKNLSGDQNQWSVLNSGLHNQISIKKNHNLNFSFGFNGKFGMEAERVDFSVGLNYSYTFN